MTEPKDEHDDRAERRAGLSGTPAAVGQELGELEFEPDLLLDSLSAEIEPEPATRRGEPLSTRSDLSAGPKLHEPLNREYPDDEVTVVGRSDAIDAVLSELQQPAELAPDEIDELDELLGDDPSGARTPASPKVVDKPPPVPRAIPRAGAPSTHKQTLVGLQPVSASQGSSPPSIPRPSIPRPLGAKPAAPPAPSALSRPKPAEPAAPTYSLDEEENEEPTRVFSGSALIDEELAQVQPLAAPLPKEASQPAPAEPAKPVESVPAEDRLAFEEKRDEREQTPLSARTTIADAGPADDFLARAESFPPTTTDFTRPTERPLADEGDFDDGARLSEPALITADDFELLERFEERRTIDSDQPTLLPPDSFPPPQRPSRPASKPAPAGYEATSDERSAADHLRERGKVQEFAARAEWFEREARAKTDPQAKARLLLLASELWAMTGDSTRARNVASESAIAGKAMALPVRQARWIAASEGDYKAVAAALELEIRSSPTPEARVHAAYLSAEVHRLSLQDEATGRKKLDVAIRAHAEDPRPHVYRLADTLGKSAAPPKFKWPEQPAFSELAQATQAIAARRAAQGNEPFSLAPAVFAAARQAVARGDRTRAAQAFERLAGVDGLRAPATWLAAALAAHESSSRPLALHLLSSLGATRHPELKQRTLAARALEQGDGSALDGAIASPAGGFSLADRLALAGLTGSAPEALSALATELAGNPDYATLALAAQIAASRPSTSGAGSPPARAELQLGRALASTPADPKLEALRPAIESYATTHAEAPLAALLDLELALGSRASQKIAAAVNQWPAPEADTRGKADVELVRGLLFELGGDAIEARDAYLAALARDPRCEAALRAVLPALAPEQASQAFAALAESTSDPSQSALFHLQIVLGAPPADPREVKERLTRAREADPALPLTYRVAEQFARSRGDADELSHWLRARREVSGDDVASALDLVREALLIADSDLTRSAELLGEAVRVRPADVGLRELFERLRPGADLERGEWREAVAQQASARAKALLLLQAAFEYERAGEPASAARAARAADEAGAGPLAAIMAVRTAIGTPEATRVSEELLSRAKEASDAIEQRELYEQLSEFDRARGDASSAMLWQAALLERSPDHLPALRRIEQAYISSGRDDDLEGVAAQLARLLDDAEGVAHARLSARLRRKSGAWLLTREMAELAMRGADAPLWALRALASYARAADEPALSLTVERKLAERASHPLDRATLLLRAAEAATRLGQLEVAREQLELALEHVPDHLMALTTLAEVLEASGDFRGAAKGLEAVAEASSVDAHRVAAWHQAAVFWLDRVQDVDRARLALEQAVAIDITHEDSVLRLQSLYVSAGDAKSLSRLLERRLERATDPDERAALEVARGRALAEVGERDAAKAALSSALDENPEHVEALEAFADLCAAEGDWASAEQALIRLGRHVADPRRQAEIYKKLGELYDGPLPNLERAELAYQEVLKREPDDALAIERLGAVFGKLGQPERAVDLAQKLLDRAVTSDEKRDRTLSLALVYEQVAADKKRAAGTFEKARKEWPHDGVVLRALVEHHLRAGEARAAQVLLERAATDARRALATGRFEPSFFDVLAMVAELRGAADMAIVAQATLSALRGQEAGLGGVGSAAGDARLDDLVAPELLSPALRALLRKTSPLLDTAYAPDLRGLRATPLPLDAYTEHANQLASAFGLRGVEFYSSPAVGSGCMALTSSVPRIVFGTTLLASSDDAARYFLLIRALKLVQAGAATLARIAPIELAAVTSGLLATFAPNWSPQGLDAKKVSEATKRIQGAMQERIDDDVPVLALEVIGSLGNRATQLGTALGQWASRVALLAVGDPNAALRALALGSGHALPAEGSERLRFVVRHAEARDLAVFSVGDSYSEARARFGLRG